MAVYVNDIDINSDLTAKVFLTITGYKDISQDWFMKSFNVLNNKDIKNKSDLLSYSINIDVETKKTFIKLKTHISNLHFYYDNRFAKSYLKISNIEKKFEF